MASVIQAERDSLLSVLTDSMASLDAQLTELADSSKTDGNLDDSTSANGTQDAGIQTSAAELGNSKQIELRKIDS